MKKIKITHISDTHGHIPSTPNKCDIMIHTGDHDGLWNPKMEYEANTNHKLMNERKFIEQYENFNAWIGAMKEKGVFKDFIYVPGNHFPTMFINENDSPSKRFKNIMSNAYVVDSHNPIFKIQGVSFFGTSLQTTFGKWSFNKLDDELKEYFEKYMKNDHIFDIILSHAPPSGILDRAYRNYGRNVEETGCKFFADFVWKNVVRRKTQAVLFGHIHESYGMLEQFGCKFINSAAVDFQYNANRKPHTFEIEIEDK